MRADSHDLIRVHGARENNLKDVRPTLARPDVDVLEGLTTAIIVDQERMGANARSTVGTVTDAHAMLRILFSRPNAFSFNVPSVRARGAITIERGGEHLAAYVGG